MDISPYLIVKKLVIKGVTSKYEASFKEGLNIIWGDMDCGKSSILNLIDYCLGGSNENLSYEEISSKGRSAQLEVDLNGSICTFERSISDDMGAIKVFMCEIDEVGLTFPMLMSGSPSKDMPDGWVSDFILDSLGIAKVSIKESRVRDDAASDRLSFRDLMKLLYLKQTKVGADSLLNFGNPSVFNKNIEVQKFVYNIHDDKISALNQDLAAESGDLQKLRSNQVAVSKFLSDVSIPLNQTSADDQIEMVKEDLISLDEGAVELKKDYKFATNLALSMAGEISSLKVKLGQVNNEVQENLQKYKSFSSLKSTYANDLECLGISKLARESVPIALLKDHKLSCPLCSSEVPLVAEYIQDDVIDAEIKSIRNRVSGLQGMLDELWVKNKELELEGHQVAEVLKGKSVEFDSLNIENISALLQSIEAVERQKVELRVRYAQLKRDLAINNKYNDLEKKIENKELVILRLKKSIKIAQDALVGLEGVIENLSGILRYYLRKSGLQNVRDIYFDKKFTPHFRGISYYVTSSGGVRTITSILSFAARLKYLLRTPGNLPTFLMVDTPGQNIGRNVRDDEESDVSDPVVYDKIFKRFSSICKFASVNGLKCQIIVVDNDLPKFLVEGENFHLVKRFSKHGEKFEKGLINDY